MAEQPGISVFTPPKSAPANTAPAQVERNTAPVRSATSADGVQSSPASSPAERLWAEQRARTVAADVWQRDDVTITKNADGVLSVKPRDGGAPAVPDAGARPGQPGQQPQPGDARVADGRLVLGDVELTTAQAKELMAEKAARDSRAATMPKDAAGYSLDLPEGFELPPGVDEWRWNLEDPTSAALLGQAKEWAFAHQIDGPAFSKLLALYASNQIVEQRRFDQARKAEIDKLGPNVSARVDAVGTLLESQLGTNLAHALRQTMVTARSVEAYEKLMRNFISQGIGGNPGRSRDGAGSQPERMSDEEYSKLSYHEKLLYAQRFTAQQPNASRR
jgi:hypothetical protein